MSAPAAKTTPKVSEMIISSTMLSSSQAIKKELFNVTFANLQQISTAWQKGLEYLETFNDKARKRGKELQTSPDFISYLKPEREQYLQKYEKCKEMYDGTCEKISKYSVEASCTIAFLKSPTGDVSDQKNARTLESLLQGIEDIRQTMKNIFDGIGLKNGNKGLTRNIYRIDLIMDTNRGGPMGVVQKGWNSSWTSLPIVSKPETSMSDADFFKELNPSVSMAVEECDNTTISVPVFEPTIPNGGSLNQAQIVGDISVQQVTMPLNCLPPSTQATASKDNSPSGSPMVMFEEDEKDSPPTSTPSSVASETDRDISMSPQETMPQSISDEQSPHQSGSESEGTEETAQKTDSSIPPAQIVIENATSGSPNTQLTLLQRGKQWLNFITS